MNPIEKLLEFLPQLDLGQIQTINLKGDNFGTTIAEIPGFAPGSGYMGTIQEIIDLLNQIPTQAELNLLNDKLYAANYHVALRDGGVKPSRPH